MSDTNVYANGAMNYYRPGGYTKLTPQLWNQSNSRATVNGVTSVICRLNQVYNQNGHLYVVQYHYRGFGNDSGQTTGRTWNDNPFQNCFQNTAMWDLATVQLIWNGYAGYGGQYFNTGACVSAGYAGYTTSPSGTYWASLN